MHWSLPWHTLCLQDLVMLRMSGLGCAAGDPVMLARSCPAHWNIIFRRCLKALLECFKAYRFLFASLEAVSIWSSDWVFCLLCLILDPGSWIVLQGHWNGMWPLLIVNNYARFPFKFVFVLRFAVVVLVVVIVVFFLWQPVTPLKIPLCFRNHVNPSKHHYPVSVPPPCQHERYSASIPLSSNASKLLSGFRRFVLIPLRCRDPADASKCIFIFSQPI